ncbi:uncharacterized protein Dvar_65350 [Desulfosarcina variabilis str. Montpellier]
MLFRIITKDSGEKIYNYSCILHEYSPIHPDPPASGFIFIFSFNEPLKNLIFFRIQKLKFYIGWPLSAF